MYAQKAWSLKVHSNELRTHEKSNTMIFFRMPCCIPQASLHDGCETLIVCSSTLRRVMECQRGTLAQRGSIIKESKCMNRNILVRALWQSLISAIIAGI